MYYISCAQIVGYVIRGNEKIYIIVTISQFPYLNDLAQCGSRSKNLS